MVKHLNLAFDEKTFEKMKKLKGKDKSWENFIIELFDKYKDKK